MSRPGTPFLSSALLSEVGARLSRSLPPCGGGLGRGVAAAGLPTRTPLLAPLRAADLPRKGGGNKKGG
jgi:hypothetical protein